MTLIQDKIFLPGKHQSSEDWHFGIFDWVEDKNTWKINFLWSKLRAQFSLLNVVLTAVLASVTETHIISVKRIVSHSITSLSLWAEVEIIKKNHV